MTEEHLFYADPETPSNLIVDTEQDSIKVEWDEVVINAVCNSLGYRGGESMHW